MKRDFSLKRKLGVVATAFVLAFSMSVTAFAAEETPHELYNVSTVAPTETNVETNIGGISIYGLDKPSTSNYVDLNSKPLTFAGNAQGSTLYTNKHFTGKSTVGYSITNYSNSKLTVKFYTSKGWFNSKKITIEANATLTGTISGLDSDKLYYLTFSAPSDFSGSVY